MPYTRGLKELWFCGLCTRFPTGVLGAGIYLWVNGFDPRCIVAFSGGVVLRPNIEWRVLQGGESAGRRPGCEGADAGGAGRLPLVHILIPEERVVLEIAPA